LLVPQRGAILAVLEAKGVLKVLVLKVLVGLIRGELCLCRLIRGFGLALGSEDTPDAAC
jgi:hypothetical protein